MDPVVIRLTAERIVEESATYSGTARWVAIQSIEEIADHIFLMRAKRNGYVIPRRCFATREAEAIFLNQASFIWNAPQQADHSDIYRAASICAIC